MLLKVLDGKKTNSFDKAVKYCKENAMWCQLHSKNTQYPTGQEYTLEELNKFKKEYENKGFECFLINK